MVITAFCTITDGIETIANLTVKDSDTDHTVNATNLTIKNNAIANGIKKVLSRKGIVNKADSIDSIYNQLDSHQKNLLQGINTNLLSSFIIDDRSVDIGREFKRLVTSLSAIVKRDMELFQANLFYNSFVPQLAYNAVIPINRPYWINKVYNGSHSDLLIVNGEYSDNESTVFTLKIIDSSHFQWKENNGAYSSTIAITGEEQLLANNIFITLPITGNIANDTYTITIIVTVTADIVSGLFAGWNPSDPNSKVLKTSIDNRINWSVAKTYSLAARRQYRLRDLNQDQAEKYGNLIALEVAGYVCIAYAFEKKSSFASRFADIAMELFGKFIELQNNLIVNQHDEVLAMDI